MRRTLAVLLACTVAVFASAALAAPESLSGPHAARTLGAIALSVAMMWVYWKAVSLYHRLTGTARSMAEGSPPNTTPASTWVRLYPRSRPAEPNNGRPPGDDHRQPLHRVTP